MSTTFVVYPTVDKIPTFAELLELADEHLKAFLREVGQPNEIRLSVGMRDNGNRIVSMSLADTAWWSPENYAWFYVEGMAGGTDAYARSLDDLDRDILVEEVATRRQGAFAEAIPSILNVGRLWYFRRSAGQPAIINIAYGLLAASLAHLTNGIIDSGDNAWDSKSLPARPPEFFTSYFRPTLTSHPAKREWAERCIAHLSDEMRRRSARNSRWWRRVFRRP